MARRRDESDPVQLEWLEEKHQKNLEKLGDATSVDHQIYVAAEAASEFLRSTVEWDRTFELIHEWLERARKLLSAHTRIESLEAYAYAAKGWVAKSVFFDKQIGTPEKKKKKSTRGMATVEVALELCDLAKAHPDSWQIVRAAADAMAELMLGRLHCGYRLDFDPFTRLQEIAASPFQSASPDAHVVEVYLDILAERIKDALRRGKSDAREQWEEFRALVSGVQNVEPIAGPYCKAVTALIEVKAYPDAAWIDREVALTTGWWASCEGWFGVRSKLYPHLGRLLERAIKAAPDKATRKRYERLYDEYVESLPDWE